MSSAHPEFHHVPKDFVHDSEILEILRANPPEALKTLNGELLDIDSTRGAGTRFTIHLPVSLAVSQVVLLAVDDAKFAVQAALVEQILQVRPEALAAAYASHSIECDGESVPMYFLGSLLEIPRCTPLRRPAGTFTAGLRPTALFH